MKRIIASAAALLMSASLLTGCYIGDVDDTEAEAETETETAVLEEQPEPEEENEPDETEEQSESQEETESQSESVDDESEQVTITVRTTIPNGKIGVGDEDANAFEMFDGPEYTFQCNKGESFSFCEETSIGYKFIEWTKNGEHISDHWFITDSSEEDAEYTAVYEAAQPVTIGEYATLGEFFSDIEGYEYANIFYNDKHFVYDVFCDGVYYRTTSEITDELKSTFDSVFQTAYYNEEPVEFYEDEDGSDPMPETIKDLKLVSVEVMNDDIIFPEELEQLIGKTGEELADAGWVIDRFGWCDGGVAMTCGKGHFVYSFTFDGMEELYDQPTAEELASKTVKEVHIFSIRYKYPMDSVPWEECPPESSGA